VVYKPSGVGHWLNANGLVAAVCAALGMETVEAEAEAKRAKRRREENRQTCPACFRDICVDLNGTMVHHGYERPGDGQIHGDCFGVGYASYEESPKGTQDFLRRVVEPELEMHKATLARYEAQPDDLVTRNGVVKKGEGQYDYELRSAIDRAKWLIKNIERDIAFLQGKIDNWKPEETQ
jgi:hypothetical protein